jgi:hypothetical protein
LIDLNDLSGIRCVSTDKQNAEQNSCTFVSDANAMPHFAEAGRDAREFFIGRFGATRNPESLPPINACKTVGSAWTHSQQPLVVLGVVWQRNCLAMVTTDVTQLAGCKARMDGFPARGMNLIPPLPRAETITSSNQEHHVRTRKHK